MKKYIKTSEIPIDLFMGYDAEVVNNTIRLYVDITVEFEKSPDVLCAIKPLYIDGVPDHKAILEYNTFINTVIGAFQYYGFKILKQKDSDYSKTSKYFVLAKKTQYDNKNIKYLIYIRISNHESPTSKHATKKIQREREQDAETFKLPQTKSKQKWKEREIVVNSDHFNSYDEAEDDVWEKLDRLNTILGE